jgi:hypothetical protein
MITSMTQQRTKVTMASERPRMRSLETDGPYPELKEKLMLFGQFAGTWQYESEYYLPDGSSPTASGEIHFGWILNGTAIQDTMTGVIHNPPQGIPRTGFGTVVRFYDPKIDAWHCTWIGPSTKGGGVIQNFIARKIGDEIVLEGKNPEDFLEHWIFSEITENSFKWRAEESRDNGKTWRLDQRIWAKRISSNA